MHHSIADATALINPPGAHFSPTRRPWKWKPPRVGDWLQMRGAAMSDYATFLREKIRLAQFGGFNVSPEEVNPALKPHTSDIVRWACQGGNRAVFASFGLHKTATNLEVMRLIGVHRPGLR